MLVQEETFPHSKRESPTTFQGVFKKVRNSKDISLHGLGLEDLGDEELFFSPEFTGPVGASHSSAHSTSYEIAKFRLTCSVSNSVF